MASAEDDFDKISALSSSSSAKDAFNWDREEEQENDDAAAVETLLEVNISCFKLCLKQMLRQAMRSGSLTTVEYLFAKFGPQLFRERDEYGHSPAHWMALNGHVNIAR